MRSNTLRYDTRESLMEALRELITLKVAAEDVAPVLCTIGPVDLDLLADCMRDAGLDESQAIAA